MRLDLLIEADYAKPVIAYHGTSALLARSILKHGMVPEPKQRVWDQDDNVSSSTASRQSLSGSYWTTNLGTATSSATKSAEKFKATADWRDQPVLIVIAQIIEQSAVADEDSINFDINTAWAMTLRNVLGVSSDAIRAVLIGMFYPHAKQEETRHNLLSNFIKELHQSLSTDSQPAPLDLLRATFFAFFNRLLAHSVPKDDYYSPMKEIPEENRPPVPTIPEAEAAFLKVRDALTRYYRKTAYKKAGQFAHTFRMVDPVGYSGANKIIALVQYSIMKSDDPLILLYGDTIPEDFIQQWTNRKGPFPGLIRSNGETIMGPRERVIESRQHWEQPSFQQWFAGSKVVNPKGRPLVVYHGSKSPWVSSFDLDQEGSGMVRPTPMGVIWFAGTKSAASWFADPSKKKRADSDGIMVYGDDPERMYAGITNEDGEMIFTVGPTSRDRIGELAQRELERYNAKLRSNTYVTGCYLRMLNPLVLSGRVPRKPEVAAAKAGGHDGIIAHEIADGAEFGTVYVVFDPAQVKSVDNVGTYDSSPNLRENWE